MKCISGHIVKRIVLILSIVISSCSTEKNTLVTRSYHNLTSHYNVYFNAYDSYREGMLKLNKSYQEDYTHILPIFKYTNDEYASILNSNMDRVIEKSTKTISLHSITAKPKNNKRKNSRQKEAYKKNEYTKWIDDAYLLMAKAYYHKSEFSSAIQNLEYLIREHDGEPIKNDALTWLAKVYLKQGQSQKAQQYLSMAGGSQKMNRDSRIEYYLTYADVHAYDKDYQEAIPKLRNAVSLIRKKNERARYSFILAQYYQATGDLNNASRFYDFVIKKSPNYEMTFNARINKATSFERGNSSDKLKEELEKMLRDEKNKDYRDQIYFALGNIAEKENIERLAIQNYKEASVWSTSNDRQRVKTFLALGRIYFDRQDFKNAYFYYDSAMTYIDPGYPNYSNISVQSGNLTRLAKNLIEIETQDSLQYMASLDEEDRLAMIDREIERIQEQNRLQQEQQSSNSNNLAIYNQNMNRNRDNATNTGKWYFYNVTSLSFGENEFKRKWGERKLEDNWRRKNKKAITFANESQSETTDTAMTTQNILDNTTRQYYLQEIPLTDEQMEVSNKKIQDALFEVAEIYKTDFAENEKAIESYEELNYRFPGNIFEPSVFYYLVELYTNENNQAKADFYRSQLIAKHPESKFSKALTDPNFLSNLIKQKEQTRKLYEEALSYYTLGNYEASKSTLSKLVTAYPENNYQPKIDFLTALIIGKTANNQVFRISLENVIKNYPNDEVAQRAKEIIPLLEQEELERLLTKTETNETEKAEETTDIIDEVEIFVENTEMEHYMIFVVRKAQVDFNQLNFNVINYNLDKDEYVNLSSTVVDFDETYKFILIQTLDNKTSAVNYSQELLNSSEIFSGLENSQYFSFVISTENYSTLMADKSIPKYMRFYTNHY